MAECQISDVKLENVDIGQIEARLNEKESNPNMKFLYNLNTKVISKIDLNKLPKLYKKKLAHLVTFKVIRNIEL